VYAPVDTVVIADPPSDALNWNVVDERLVDIKLYFVPTVKLVGAVVTN
jgi:hypothetical protein